MTERIELFERRNRSQTVALVVLATLNDIVAGVMAAIALGIVSRSTAPLWLEFRAHVLGPFPSWTAERLARELLLDERIDHLRELAGQPARR